ncbi:MAG: addiction module antitoxin [Gammaproteobacteria bacterium]|nr:MAG: addiction module antitoxin [Gammaproteobacteria bacterium]
MKIQLRRVGNSVGQIIPASILRTLDLRVGDELELSIVNGQLIATPVKVKAQYTLDELLAKCNENAPVTEEVKAWENMQPVGLEGDF